MPVRSRATGVITGTAKGVSVAGSLAPGAPGTAGGTLTIAGAGGLTFSSKAVYLDTINATTASSTLINTGTVSLNGAKVDIASSLVTPGTTYTIMVDTAGGLGGSNTFNSAPISYLGQISATNPNDYLLIGSLSYVGGDDVDLTFAVHCYAAPYPYTNAGKTPGLCVLNTSFIGNVGNTGTITQNGIVVTNSTIMGSIVDSGTLTGGIAIDSASKVIATSGAAISVTGATFVGVIANAGLISAVAGTGIFVSGVTTLLRRHQQCRHDLRRPTPASMSAT